MIRSTLGRIVGVILFCVCLTGASPLGNTQEARWKELNAQLESLFKQRNYRDALPIAEEAFRIAERTFDKDDIRIVTTGIFLGALYYRMGRYGDAIPVYERMVEILTHLGPDDPATAKTVRELAVLLLLQGRLADAEVQFKRALQIQESQLGPRHPDVAETLKGLGDLHRQQAKFKEGETELQRALEILEKRSGSNGLGAVLNNLGLLYQEQGKYREAERQYIRARAADEKEYGPENINYAVTVENLGNLFAEQGKYIEAQVLLADALRIQTAAWGPDHPEVANTVNGLAVLQKDLGNYEEAERLHKRALEIRERVLHPYHPDVANSYNNLGTVYSDQGKYQEAEAAYARALAIQYQGFGRNNPVVAVTLNNLAHLYREQWKNDEAGRLYERALEINEDTLGPTHLSVATSLSNLALLRLDQGKADQAASYLQRALAIAQEIGGPNHPDVANALNNLAGVELQLGRYSKAEQHFSQALKIFEGVYGKSHPSVTTALWNLGQLMYAGSRPREASVYFERGLQQLTFQFEQQFAYMTEAERLGFVDTVRGAFPILFSFFLTFRDDPMLAGKMYDAVLVEKGLVASSVAGMRSRIAASGDEKATAIFAALTENKRRLFRLSSDPHGDRDGWRSERASLESEIANLERELIKRSTVFAASATVPKPAWQGVRDHLKEGEAAIEFVRFPFFDGKEWSDVTKYVALVVTRDSRVAPTLVPLGDARALECGPLNEYTLKIEFLRREGQPMPCPPGDRTSALALTPTFYQAFWKPLESALGNARRLYVSVDGVLNQVALNVVTDERGVSLLEKYELRVVLSTRDLLQSAVHLSSPSAVLVGNPLFSIDESSYVSAAQAFRAKLRAGDAARGAEPSRNGRETALRGEPLEPLPTTSVEVSQIGTLLRSKRWAVEILEGKDAIVEAIKAVRAPRVLHLATHGDFAADPTEERRQTFTLIGTAIGGSSAIVRDPMLRSGLFFTGANRYRAGLPPPGGVDDGVLTAYEASQLNLFGTELVVLSACKTGLGQAREGEGVFGLRRAFQIAGAQAVLMTMWSVPDEDTQALMTLFYQKWLAGADKHAALREAQQELSKKTADPSRWGAFVLVGR